MDFLLQQSPAGRSAPWSSTKQQFTAALQLLQAGLEHDWHKATFSFGQGLSLGIGQQMRWDCGFARSCLMLTECSWYLKVQHWKICLNHLKEDKEKQVKNKCLSLSKVDLVWEFFWYGMCGFYLHVLFWDIFPYFDQFMRIQNNCKMDQQENMVGLHSCKLNYLNSSKEK